MDFTREQWTDCERAALRGVFEDLDAEDQQILLAALARAFTEVRQAFDDAQGHDDGRIMPECVQP